MIDEFLQRYPLWPRALAEKFSAVLAYAMPESAEYLAAKQFYDNVTNKTFSQIVRISAPLSWDHQFTVTMLTPTNDRYKRTQNIEQPFLEYPIDTARGDGNTFWPINSIDIAMGRFRPYIYTLYDDRIFHAPENRVVYKFTPTYGPYALSVMFFMFYMQVSAYSGYTELIAEARAAVKSFSGLSSIIALHENQVSIRDVDINQIYDFSTYINTYQNYSGELQAEQNLLKQKANIAVNDYRRQLDDQAAREYADLQAKKIQLLIAIDNDAKSAQRDFQNMLLTAQGLKNQIGVNLV